MLARMKHEDKVLAFELGPTSIDKASEWLVDNLAEVGANRPDIVRMRLLFEEGLLNLIGHFGNGKAVRAYLERRQGRYRVRMVVSGERFNPLKSEASEPGELSTSLFSLIDMSVQYSYSKGANIVRISLPRTTMNPVLKIAVALLIGALVGLLGDIAVPHAEQELFSKAVLVPIANMWLRLLQAISGPVIFLMALMATFDTKCIADLGGSRVSVLVRYFAISSVVVMLTLGCLSLLMPMEIGAVEASGGMVSVILDNVLRIIPGNLVEPFSTANAPQLLLVAIVTGYLLAFADSQVGELKSLVEQLNALGLTVAKQVSMLVPFFAGLLLCLQIWTHDIGLLRDLWIPLALSALLAIIVLSGALLLTALRFRVSPLTLARKLKGPFVDSLKRGTLDASAFDGLAGQCKRLLGVDGEFARASVPTGLFLYMPVSAVGICVFVLFAAQAQHLHIDQVWVAAIAALSVVLSVATPPVTGANLLSFIMIFSYLGISNDVLLDIMVFDIVFGVVCVAFDQAMLQIDLTHQAEHLGFLNRVVLREPLQ